MDKRLKRYHVKHIYTRPMVQIWTGDRLGAEVYLRIYKVEDLGVIATQEEKLFTKKNKVNLYLYLN